MKVQLSDDFKEHLLEDGMEFPSYGGWVDVAPWICHLLLGEMLDANGNEFTQWAKEELTAWGKIAYRKKDNSWIPMLIDGTNLEGYVCKRDGPLGPKGTQVVAHQAGPSQFWAYAVAYRITGDGFMWQMARNIAQGSNFGDIGETPSSEPRIEMDIARAAPTVLLGFLELFKKTEKKAYLKMAEKIGNNILSECFNKGFFTYSNKHLYAKFDFVAPLALLHLDTSLQAREWNIPKVWPVNSYFHCPYDGFGRTYDNLVIYSRTEENHLDFELFEAVHSGDTKKFAGLISNGADINATKGSFWSDTLLHSAVRAGRKNIIELLIQKGADVNKTNKDGETPLYYAALSGHKDIAELLIEKGAEMSAIHLAAYMGDIAKVKAFVREGIDINALDKRNMAALHFAARGDQTDTAELLIAQGAEVDIGSRTPLCVAVEANNIDVAEILIVQGANVNANPEWTPLQEAAYHSKEMVELLLTKGADINAGKWTALHSALDAERFDILELLLAKGADVNIRDDEGRTPLHIAAWYAASNNPKVVELLLSKGADVTAKDNDSKTALSWAVEKGHTEIVELLKKHMLLHDVMVTNATVPSACVQGDTLPVTISVANKGDQTETFRVVLFDIVSGEEIADREMTLEPQKYRSANAADLILSPTSSGKGNFGWGFNVHGDVNRDGYGDLLVGAGWWNEAKGRAYFYFGGVDMDGIPDLIFEGEAAGDFLGDGGAALGDVNGDGYDDVIIGARGYHNNDGRLYIFFGGIDVDKEADVLLEGEPGKAGYFSCNCLSVGDVDKDGYVDVLVGACFYDKKRGKVYLYYGGDPMDSLADVVFEGEHADDFFGRNATIGQDIDGDGYRDILIGARQAPEGTRNGRAYLFYGGDRNQMDAVCDMTFTPPTSGQRSFGSSLDIYDIDSDGHGDVVIGARSSQGAVFVYWGDERDKMDAIADVVILGEDGARSCLGGDKLFCADFNRDGYGDIAVGAYNWLKRSRTGRTYVYYGGTKTSINTQPDVIFTGETGGSWFGHDIGGGDFNNDGYTDLVAGAWGYNNEEGRAYVFYAPLENKTDITFNWDTTAATPGKHTLRATIAPIEGEEDTADNAMTVEVKVKTPSR